LESLVEIQVLYQDSSLLVINKPAGLATLPDGYDSTLPHVKSLLELQFGRLWIVHRLDKNTSGILLLARTAVAHRSLNSQFEQHKIIKIYHVLVVGSPGWDEKAIDLPLRSNGDRQHRTVVDTRHGKPALTDFKILERFGNYSLLQAAPETGRTHQIRAHLLAVGLHILGDKLYGLLPTSGESPAFSQELLLPWTHGIALHAWSVELAHPLTGETLEFNAPYPELWNEVLAVLRSQAHNS
jgi:RluA family pseudouridine synthase